MVGTVEQELNRLRYLVGMVAIVALALLTVQLSEAGPGVVIEVGSIGILGVGMLLVLPFMVEQLAKLVNKYRGTGSDREVVDA